jgi:hypothetical protein
VCVARSENLLKLTPDTPQYLPGDATLQRACDLLASLFPTARKTCCETTETVRFVDARQNWERTLCPVCLSELDEDWWVQAMRAASHTDFRALSVVTPCCGNPTSLNDLRYEWPVGFARLVCSVYSPGGDIDAQQINVLEQTLGCRLCEIWAHY